MLELSWWIESRIVATFAVSMAVVLALLWAYWKLIASKRLLRYKATQRKIVNNK